MASVRRAALQADRRGWHARCAASGEGSGDRALVRRRAMARGCTVFVPFQDPENVGAVIRSAAAFGAARVVLLREAAHPFLPRASRAAGPAVFQVPLQAGPALAELRVENAPLIALDMTGRRAGRNAVSGAVRPGRWARRVRGLPEGLQPLRAPADPDRAGRRVAECGGRGRDCLVRHGPTRGRGIVSGRAACLVHAVGN